MSDQTPWDIRPFTLMLMSDLQSGATEATVYHAAEVDTARAQVDAQHAAEIADCERQIDCMGVEMAKADATIAQLTTVLQWAQDVLNATVLGLPLPPLPK